MTEPKPSEGETANLDAVDLIKALSPTILAFRDAGWVFRTQLTSDLRGRDSLCVLLWRLPSPPEPLSEEQDAALRQAAQLAESEGR